MKKFFLALAVALSATAAHAQNELVPWSTTAGWNVAVHKPTRSCGMYRDFSRGTRLSVMYHRNSKAFSLSINNPVWDEVIVNGREYPVTIDMDGSRWDGIFKGRATAGHIPYIMAEGLKGEFLIDFMRRNSIRIYNRSTGAFLVGVTLTGSSAALTEMLECQYNMSSSLEN